MNPVAPIAQKKVKVPDDLDLDQWINEPDEEEEETVSYGGGGWNEFIADHPDDEEKATPEDLEKRKAANKIKRALNPYILGSGEESPNEDDIPTQILSKDEMGITVNAGPTSFKMEPKMKGKRGQQVTVMKDYEMPEDFDEDEAEGQKEEDDDDNPWAKIELSSPLRADEQLRAQEHRKVAQKSGSKEKDVKKKGKKKGPGGSGEKPEKKRRERKGSASEAKKEGPLIDLFDPLAAPGRQPADYAEVSSPSAPEERKSRKGAKEGKTREGKPRVHKEKPTKGAAVKKEEKKPRKKEAEASETKTATGPTKPVPKYKPLCQDENMSLIYQLQTNPNEGKKILAAIAIKNLSREQINGIEFSIPGTLNSRVNPASNIKPPLVLEPAGTGTHNIIFDVQSIDQPQKLSGSVSYQVGGRPGKKDLQFLFPCSAFFLPIKLEKEDFVSIIRTNQFTLASTILKPEDEFNTFIVSLAILLHVELIIMDKEGRASFYGKSIQGHHLALLAKPIPNGVSVDLKCTEPNMATNLIAEVNNFFPH